MGRGAFIFILILSMAASAEEGDEQQLALDKAEIAPPIAPTRPEGMDDYPLHVFAPSDLRKDPTRSTRLLDRLALRKKGPQRNVRSRRQMNARQTRGQQRKTASVKASRKEQLLRKKQIAAKRRLARQRKLKRRAASAKASRKHTPRASSRQPSRRK